MNFNLSIHSVSRGQAPQQQWKHRHHASLSFLMVGHEMCFPQISGICRTLRDCKRALTNFLWISQKWS